MIEDSQDPEGLWDLQVQVDLEACLELLAKMDHLGSLVTKENQEEKVRLVLLEALVKKDLEVHLEIKEEEVNQV